MSNEIKTQVVVLGAGPGGYSAAFRAATPSTHPCTPTTPPMPNSTPSTSAENRLCLVPCSVDWDPMRKGGVVSAVFGADLMSE